MDAATQIVLHKIIEGGWAVKDIFKTENEKKGTTMYHDSTQYPEKVAFQGVDWTKLADATNITIHVKAPTGKAGLLGKDAEVTVIDELAPNFPYGIEKVIFNPPATVVIWSDDEKTVVKTSKDDVFSKETGLAMAIAKRYFGSRSKFLEAVENAEGEVPETPTPARNAEIAYLCDGKACREPIWCSARVSSRPDIACTHTFDIRHAANFVQMGPNLWYEKGQIGGNERSDAE